jgi:hypothetical protein
VSWRLGISETAEHYLDAGRLDHFRQSIGSPSNLNCDAMRHGFVLVGALFAAIAALTVGSASARDTASSAVGVSSLSYAPKPFYDDLSRMRVRFTTTGRAKPGTDYSVVLLIDGPDAGPDASCQNLAVSFDAATAVNPRRIVGAPGKTYTVWLKATGGYSAEPYFCHGRASLTVTAGKRDLRTIKFRILRAP